MGRDDAKKWFRSQQEQMRTELEGLRAVHSHPTALGDGTELKWLNMLQKRLPRRYLAEKAFVIDADGERSQQIDIVIHDRQYCPLLLDTEGGIHVPAESVYAVIEVKQDLSKRWVEYAGEKIESVRRLRRTSATYGTNVGQQQTQPKDILGGLVAYHSGWSPPFGDPFHEVLASLPAQRRLDFGCALTNGGFDIEYRGNDVQLITSEAAGSVIFFFFRLLKRLQQFGTVPAIKYDEYSNLLVDEEAHAPMRTTRTATGS